MSEPDVFAAAMAVVGAARAALAGLRDTEFWKVPDRDLLVLVREMELVGRLVFTAQVHLAGEVDTRGIAAAHGAASAAALIRSTAGVSHGDARALVSTAAAVLPRDVPSGGELPPVLPLLAQALADGGIGVAQARTVVGTMNKLPPAVDAETRVVCEEHLVAQGRVSEAAPFAVFARAVLLTLDEDGRDFEVDPPADHVEFTLGTRNPNTGLTRITGKLDDLGVEIVNQAIGALSKPVPVPEHANQHASAAAGGGDPDPSGGGDPDPSSSGGGNPAASGGGSRGLSGGGGGPDASGGGAEGVDGSAGVGSVNGSGGGVGGPGITGGRGGAGKRVSDPRPAATRRAQALLEVLRRYLDLGDAPTQGGERPHVTVTMTLQDLLGDTRDPTVGTTRSPSRCSCGPGSPGPGNVTGGGGPGNVNGGGGPGNVNGGGGGTGLGLGGNGGPGSPGGGGSGTRSAVLEYGGPVTAAQARMLACDARIIPAVLGTASQVLDVGTANRLFPPHIRRAITLRDKGCTFPGCDRPPGWTDAHHVGFWIDNGKTAYDNGCLLCRHHHSEVHRGHWTINFAADGVPEFTPPPWVDPNRTPRRNTIHHIPTLLRQ